jgi:hypothetical protein
MGTELLHVKVILVCLYKPVSPQLNDGLELGAALEAGVAFEARMKLPMAHLKSIDSRSRL